MGNRDQAKKEKTDIANKTESYYRTIFEQSPDGILVIDTNGKIIDFNEAACEHLGYSREEFTKLGIADIDSDQTPEEIRERIKTVLKDGRAEFEVKHRTKKSEIRDVLVITQVINLDGRIVLNSIWKDITDRRMAAEALQESEKRYRLIAENTYDMITRHLPDSTYIYVSPACRKLLGYKPEELIGKKAFNFMHPEDVKRVIHITQEAIRTGGSDMGQYRHLKKDGQYLWVETTGKVIKNEITGAIEDIICVVRDISDRKNFEDTLQKIHSRQKAILDNIPDIAWLKDKESSFIAVNEPFGKACGVKPDDLIGKSDLDIWPKELAEKYRADDKEVMETRKRKQLEEPLIDKDGNKTWIETIKTPIFDSTGEVIGTTGIAHDITERKRFEESLRDEKHFSENIINSLPGVFYMFDSQGNLVRWNRTFAEVIGYTADELAHMHGIDFFEGEDKALIARSMQRVFEEGEADAEAYFVTKSGEKIPYYFTGLRTVIKDTVYLIGLGIDITARRKIEEELHDSYFDQSAINIILSESLEDRPLEEILQKALNMILSIPWLSFEAVGNIHLVEDEPDVLVMKAWYNLPEHLKKSCAHLHFGECLCGKAALTQKIEFADHIDERHEICYEGMAPHGHYVVPLLFGGKTLGVIDIHLKEGHIRSQKEEDFLRTVADTLAGVIARRQLEDEKKKLHTQLLQAQKMEAVGQLAGGIAHDFNNILTAMIGYGHILKMKMKEDDPLRIYPDHILSLSDRAANLTQSLLAFSRKQIMNPRPTNLNEVIKLVEKLLFRIIGEEIQIRTELSEKDLIIMADHVQIEQVLMNLATNARDAMPKGGLLTIETEPVDIDHEFIREHGFGKEGKYSLVSVTDTGAGMERKTMEHIFEPFFTTKEVGKGTGLGLSMVYGIIKQHDGYIIVYSEPGKGTTFRIYLPVIQEKMQVEEMSPKVLQPLKTGTETVLLAEDEAEVRVFTKRLLEEYGYKVIEAVDGEDAISRFKMHKDTIQLLLLDVIMPNRNGKEAYEEMKKIRPDIKVLFASGYPADIVHRQGILEEGFDLIMKPASPTKLLIKIREILDK